MALTLYLLRHGQTEFSRANAFCGSGLDPHLTAEGREMAQAFADAYCDEPWRAIYCSPLRRTRETAAPLCARTGREPTILDGLAEIGYGEWEGKSVPEVEEQYHDEYLRWSADPAWNAPPGGETAIAIASRAVSAISEIRRNVHEGQVLVVSHKATIRILACSLLGVDVGRFRYRMACPVGSVTVIRFDEHGPLLDRLADTRHLSERLRSLPGT